MDAVPDTTVATEFGETLVCRPAGGSVGLFWTVIMVEALLMLCTFANIFLHSGLVWSDDLIGLLMLNACFLPMSVFTGLYLQRAYIIADAEGLRWRKAGRWRTANWKNVAAYYDGYRQSKSSSMARLSIQVTTPDGSLAITPDDWSSSAQLLQSIKQYAGEVSGPGLSGPRVKNSILPLSCCYDTAINRNVLRWLDDLHKYGLAAVAAYFALQWFTTHTLPGWQWLLTPTGLFVIVKQMLPLVLRPMYRATQPRLGDKVIADQEGLHFVTTQSETTIPWAGITDFYVVGFRYVVVTAEGEYDFLDTLTNAERLRAVIPRLAVNAGRARWRQTGGRFGTMHRREIGLADGQESVQCRYHYRSLGNCGQLWGLTLAMLFLAAVTVGPALIAWHSGSAANAQEIEVAGLGVMGISTLLWLWGNYWSADIHTDENGIMQHSLLGTRYMTWNQVREFRWEGNADLTWGCVQGMNGTIRFWKGIGDADRLAEEIAANNVVVR